jgi:uncharacterized protein YndB with AHSA1/START domain
MPTDPSRPTASPIVIERTWAATPQELWELWTTREGFASWWGPQGFRADVYTLEAVPGGLLHYDMVADSPEMVSAMQAAGQPTSHPVRARWGELRPYTRLTLVNTIDFLPGVPAYESIIQVDLLDLGGRTTMRVTLSPMHVPEMSRMQAEGFESQLTKLEARFAAR